jgi:hypothetical protein
MSTILKQVLPTREVAILVLTNHAGQSKLMSAAILMSLTMMVSTMTASKPLPIPGEGTLSPVEAKATPLLPLSHRKLSRRIHVRGAWFACRQAIGSKVEIKMVNTIIAAK